MKALVTGIPGQDACYLAKYLLDNGYDVIGGMKRYTSPNYSNLDFLHLRDYDSFTLETMDVTDIGSIIQVLQEHPVHEVYNLAAQSYVGSSWRLAHVTSHVDAMGPLNCLEAIQVTSLIPDYRPKFYQAATSEMFGNSNVNGRQNENTPFEPVSPYGIAKLYGYHITKNFRESYDAYACSGVLFNHESPIRGLQFVTRKVTDGVARIYCGQDHTIELGNLDAERDWGHAEDYVRAMHLMLQQDTPKDYIIATGVKHSVRYLCDVAFKAAGLTNWYDHVKSVDKFKRPNELHSLHADCSKARKDLGWAPKVSFEEMIIDMVEEDINRWKKQT